MFIIYYLQGESVVVAAVAVVVVV